MNGLFGLEDHWLWMIFGTVLGIAEMLVPGVFLIWIGAAALLTGGLALLLPISAITQFLIFAAASIAAIYAGRRYLARNPIASADPLLNDKGARLVGSIVTAVEPVDALQGRVKVGDGVWSAKGTEAGVGDRLRVTGTDGAVLLVERV
jgi:membrane protein implicated in regulation of membrane protease activity